MDRLSAALARIDEVCRADPERIGGDPGELVYARRMTAWLERLEPAAPASLRLAVRAQHAGRWRLPRREFPAGVIGYKAWRAALARRHGDEAAAIAREVGYDEAFAARVRALVMKQGYKVDPEAQTVEDVACLVFLEHYLADFAAKHERGKLVEIVAKTWRKMSPRAHAAAKTLPLAGELAAIVTEAVTGAESAA